MSVKVEIVETGDGQHYPQSGDIVRVHYTAFVSDYETCAPPPCPRLTDTGAPLPLAVGRPPLAARSSRMGRSGTPR